MITIINIIVSVYDTCTRMWNLIFFTSFCCYVDFLFKSFIYDYIFYYFHPIVNLLSLFCLIKLFAEYLIIDYLLFASEVLKETPNRYKSQLIKISVLLFIWLKFYYLPGNCFKIILIVVVNKFFSMFLS